MATAMVKQELDWQSGMVEATGKYANMGYFFIALTIFFTVYGQVVLKWQMIGKSLPVGTSEKLTFMLKQYTNPWILSCFVAAFLASMCWMVAMTKFELSFAYPFMSLAFVLVMILSALFFSEALNFYKVAGTLTILLGLLIMTRGL